MAQNDIRNNPNMTNEEMIQGLGMSDFLLLFLKENPRFQAGNHFKIQPDPQTGHLHPLFSEEAALAMAAWAEHTGRTTITKAHHLRSQVSWITSNGKCSFPSLN